jgi:hypothetical protein
VIDKLRRAYYRRRYGPEEGDRLAAVENYMIDLYDRGRDGWARWLDRLPPEWQVPAIEWLEASKAARQAMGDVVDAIATAQRIQGQLDALKIRLQVAECELWEWDKEAAQRFETLESRLTEAAAAVDQATEQARQLVDKAKQLAEPLLTGGLIDSPDPVLY